MAPEPTPDLRPGQAGYVPPPGQWPCQHYPGSRSSLPPRLVSFLYLLLRDGAQAPGDVEQIAIHVTDAGGETFTNPHLEQYARALAGFLWDREEGQE